MSFWLKDMGWGVEKCGSKHTSVEVVNMLPEDDVLRFPARDMKLMVAIEEALAAIEKQGVAKTELGLRPSLAVPAGMPPTR